MGLAEPFLESAGRAREALAGLAGLEARLAHLVEEARRAWPDVALDAGAFVRHLGARLAEDDEPRGALAQVLAADLHLACACARGEPAALAIFEAELLPLVARYLARAQRSPAFAEEVLQTFRVRLLVGDEAQPPRIGSYRGQSPLPIWLRMIAVRTAIDLGRSGQRRAAREAEPGWQVSPPPDPELAYLKLRCRPELEAAFEATLAALEDREANVLRLHFLHGMASEAVGAMYGVSPRTVQRWIVEARQRILDETRRRLAERLNLQISEIDTVMRLVQSAVEVDLRAFLDEP